MPLFVDNVSKRFGKGWALRDISFEVGDGSVVGLFGASGSGKTVLLKAIAGSVKLTSGRILIDDVGLKQQRSSARDVSYHAGLATAEIKNLLGSFFQRRSQGHEQLSRFQTFLNSAKKTILLDDPFCGMDRSQRIDCIAAIRENAKATGKIVIFAASDFEQILEFCDEAAVLHNGMMIQSGSPQEIYDEPGTVGIAEATGDCNLIEARRVSSSDDEVPDFHSTEGGHRLFSQPTEKRQLGAINQTVTLAIRPEQVSMSLGVSFPEDNLLKGSVRSIIHRGPTSLIEFDASGLTLRTRVFRVVGLSPGDECMLGLPPHRIRVLSER